MTELSYAETAAGRLAYIRRGAGQPLLLIMGVAGHHGMWGEPFLNALAQTFDVVAFDNRGISDSFRAEAEFSIEDLADDAAAVLDHLGWESAHVMGISMGGVIAQELALRHPERVRRLVLGCTWGGPGADAGDPVWGPAIGKLAESAMSGDPEAAAKLMFEANVSPTFAAEPGRFAEFADAAAAEKVPGPVILMQMQAAAAHDALARLAELAVPTLVMHGSVDEVIVPDAGRRLAGFVPNATVEILDGAGHLFFWERPDEAAAAVTSHLRD